MHVSTIDPSALDGKQMLGESDQFAIYVEGADTYLLVQRHAATPWTAIHVSGDAVFRIGGLITEAMRHLYRDVARDLSQVR